MSTPDTHDETPKQGLAHRLYTGQVAYDFVGKRNFWYAVSAVLITVSLLALLVLRLNLGIEFKGGAEFQAPTKVTSSTVSDVRSAVEKLGLKDMSDITVMTGNDDVRVQTRALDTTTEVPQVREAIAKTVGTTPDKVASQFIGASWGKDITQQGLVALGVFLLLVMLLIWAYFREMKMSVAAIVALLHDLIITIGLYALARFSFTPATLIGVLTILGYSLYDTVVVFDKVKENTAHITQTNETYFQAANRGLNQVLVRSLNTTLIGVLPVASLLVAGAFFLGTGPLKDLGLALFIGMVAGAYSSIFIATPLLAQMKECEPEMKQHRERLDRRAQRGTASAAPKMARKKLATAAVSVAPMAASLDSLEQTDSDSVPAPAPSQRHQRRSSTRAQRKK